MGTMLALVISSNSHRRRVRSANESVAAVEALQNVTYVPCATDGTPSYQAALDTLFKTGPDVPVDDALQSGYDATFSVRYLQDRLTSTASFDDDCPGGGDQGVQEITVTIVSLNQTTVTEEVVMYKRDERADCLSEPC
ncbi:MAG: hypothetical protein KF906_06705 [Actinobacteria bacterium]|nr:hypothetical protein [Actinomycetota bacterium]